MEQIRGNNAERRTVNERRADRPERRRAAIQGCPAASGTADMRGEMHRAREPRGRNHGSRKGADRQGATRPRERDRDGEIITETPRR